MPNQSNDDRAASRAEARRRARLAARGELPEPEETQPQADTAAKGRGSFLQRIFPAAPPLPNRPDPLAGFDRAGPMRPLRERLYLLRSNLAAWLIAGVVAFIGFFASSFYRSGFLGLLGTFVLFGGLIAAGWFGWQRPTLFGTAAALVSYLLAAGLILLTFAQQGAGPQAFGGSAAVSAELIFQAVYQAALGFIGGWYGGYLRRRQAQIGAEARRPRKTR